MEEKDVPTGACSASTTVPLAINAAIIGMVLFSGVIQLEQNEKESQRD